MPLLLKHSQSFVASHITSVRPTSNSTFCLLHSLFAAFYIFTSLIYTLSRRDLSSNNTASTSTRTGAMSASQHLLCWTVCAYRKPGMSEEDYHKYMSEVHGPLVKELMVKYGMIRLSMSHNTTETRALMGHLFDPQFANIADYDCIITMVFKDIQQFVDFKADPFFKEHVGPDHEKFADTKRSKMTIGWIENHVWEGAAVVVE